MPAKLDRCVKEVKKKIRLGKTAKTYKCGKKRCKTNPYAICKSRRSKNHSKHIKYSWDKRKPEIHGYDPELDIG